MREFKTFNFNKNWLQISIMIPIFYVLTIGLVINEFPHIIGKENIDVYSSFFIVITSAFIFLFIYCVLRIFNYTIITYHGIENRMAFPTTTLIKKSWKEIKHYADVTETFSGQYGDDIIKAIWFIDYDDKVCFRLTKWGSFNFKKLIEKIDRYEDKFNIELECKNPYLTINGWKKVEYPENEKKTQKIN